MENRPAPRFHGYYDSQNTTLALAALDYRALQSSVHHYTTHTRKLSYQFHSHSHPYVTELMRRFLKGSISALQAADTEYVENGNGTLEILPGSLAAKLTSAVLKVKLEDGRQVDLPEGLPVSLPDNTQIIAGSVPTPLIGAMALTPSRGIVVTFHTNPAATGTLTINFGSQMTLARDTIVTLADGSAATLPQNTRLTLLSCKPRPKLHEDIFSTTAYGPSAIVRQPYPVKELDFTNGSPYGAYNWELFYHAPFIIANHLSKNQRFEEAQQWFHLIFDPTDDSDGPTPERFWKVKPFQYNDVKMIENILTNLSSGADAALQQETINSISAWKNAPFRPHLVARFRNSAYMFKTVMAYLDNLIAWGDSLFRQDTLESINDATQLYVLAANILGTRPQPVPRRGAVRPQTYANLRADLDKFGNVLRDLETDIPFDLAPHPNASGDVNQFAVLRGLGTALYFCVPHNDKLMSYWDTVADRLFKIHNSLNLLGIFRQLPLFEPAIDPALLAKAVAAGVDVSATVAGANQPLVPVRFQFLIQKTAEICQEVKSLGNNLLSAIEKEDNEALSILRAKHERIILGLAETVKYSQWQEAIKTREGLEKSFANAAHRYAYYERLLGKQESEINIPALDALDASALEKMKLQISESSVAPRNIGINIDKGLGSQGGGLQLDPMEAKEMSLLKDARYNQEATARKEQAAASFAIIPDIGIQGQPLGVGVSTSFGGSTLSKASSYEASFSRAKAERFTYEAGKTAKTVSYTRREQEWAFQSNLAAGEITIIFKQLRAAQIREAIAEREWKNHQQQIRNAQEIEQFLKDEKTGKKTNQAFYAWMKREVRGLYSQCFQFAFDIARKCERALQYELGNPALSFLQFSYLAGKEGLLAGEKLYLDVKRMEMAYHELNQREYELTRHISVLQLNPNALIQLRATGRCTIVLPEELFDMDGPGHYFRRIKSVALSIPCVTGPYTGVNCTLRLLKSAIRKNSLLKGNGGYTREGAEDDRFTDHFGSLQAIVTSGSQNDSGLFETNLRDERYLPFEGSGAISEWQLELPAGLRQFDYDTITDVVLHMRYTAREGGSLLGKAAADNLQERIKNSQMVGSVRLFSVRHDFPTEWAKFKSDTTSTSPTRYAELAITLRPEHYPYWSRSRDFEVKRLDLLAKTKEATITISGQPTGTDPKDTLTEDLDMGGLRVSRLTNITLPPARGKLLLYFSDNKSIDDLWLVLTWGDNQMFS
jgi:Tc toxin complex TcA C-terminal TcB-binding domain